jgi:hypothetical protein
VHKKNVSTLSQAINPGLEPADLTQVMKRLNPAKETGFCQWRGFILAYGICRFVSRLRGFTGGFNSLT